MRDRLLKPPEQAQPAVAPRDGLGSKTPAADLEQEAEQAATEVMRGTSAPSRPLAQSNAGSLARGTVPASVSQTLAGPGRPLDAATRAFMEPRFGHDFAEVRVHSDAVAARSAAELRALAYTSRPSIVFAEGHYAPDTTAGKRLLAHELAHVVQQRGVVGTPPIQRFEAPIHEATERLGLVEGADGKPARGGLTNEEASAVYFGNWMRDVNQVFVPLVKGLVEDDVVFAMISYMAAMKFGRTLTPEQFGYYIPAEHLDSAGGLVDKDDLRPKPPEITTGVKAPVRPPEFVTPQDPVGPGSKVAKDVDAPIFSVDQSGVMAYLRRSNLHMERRLRLAARSGRNPEGFLHFGAALHALEDLFAHSNWIEIAVNRVLATRRNLLPELRGPARQAFTLGPTVGLGKRGRRPVLMTGSFTSTDTQISITSEIVNFLREPLPEPASNAESKLKEQFVGKMLQSFERQLDNSATRDSVRRIVLQEVPSWLPGRESMADSVVGAPYTKIYEFGHMMPKWVPDSVKDYTTRKVKKAIDKAVSEDVMQPLARRIQAEALGARVVDTSLLQVLKDSSRQAKGEFTQSELLIMEQTKRFKGTAIEQQKENSQEAGKRRSNALQNTPLPVVAGPSHSQIAKDHVNGPFFGIAFSVASVAVRALREKMVEAWNEHGQSKPFDFGFESFPSTHDEKELFHTQRTKRAGEEKKSLARAEKIVRQGNEAGEPYDLDAMRHESAEQIRATAYALRTIATAPNESANALAKLEKQLGGLKAEQTRHVQTQLRQAAEASRAGGAKLQENVSLAPIAAAIDGHAAVIEQARTHAERATANAKLVELRNQALLVLAARPSVDSALTGAIMTALDKQIASTAVAYTSHQRRVVEGQERAPEHHGPQALPVHRLTLPSRKDESPAVQALLAKSRELFNHPYESNWWVSTVVAHIQAHPQQIAADITARNAGHPFFTRPGETDSGHEH